MEYVTWILIIFQYNRKDDSAEGEVDAEADTDEHRGQVDNNNNNNSNDDDFINVRDVLRSLQESARETAESEGII
jgi:hypothetical protein